ncbi:MAG: hypothetical protein SWK76_09205 [Actinomycetota bacterium]|nr:hypothetical protein [Actinomycetota bacterium]
MLFGLILSGVVAAARTDLVEPEKIAPMWVFQAAITYLNARGLKDEE